MLWNILNLILCTYLGMGFLLTLVVVLFNGRSKRRIEEIVCRVERERELYRH